MKMKLRDIINNFFEKPIAEVKEDNSLLYEVCSHPTKKCFMLFTDLSKKDRTLQSYIKEIAINFIDGFLFL